MENTEHHSDFKCKNIKCATIYGVTNGITLTIKFENGYTATVEKSFKMRCGACGRTLKWNQTENLIDKKPNNG